jgi:hypothetical protein
VIVLNERQLRGRRRSYFRYYHASRTHLALDKDAPERPLLNMKPGFEIRADEKAKHSSNIASQLVADLLPIDVWP